MKIRTNTPHRPRRATGALALVLGALLWAGFATGGAQPGIPGPDPGAGAEPGVAEAAKQKRPGALRGWVGGFTTTEYYPTPEYWFTGPKRSFPGISGEHRIAWLLSAHGIAMEGDGWSTSPTGEGTRWVNFVGGSVGWLNGRAQPTSPDGSGPSGWSRGAPAWLACGWKNRRGRWTFPSNYLERGAPVRWSRGRPARWVGCGDLTLQAGAGRPLRFWNSVAVDPSLFPMGRTWFYLPAYRGTRCGGWFRADDSGGAVTGHHIDVYRPPPRSAGDVITRTGQRILIVRGRKPPANPCR